MTRAALLLVVLSAAACRTAHPPQPAARNLLLVTIDTLRADRVGAYGYAAARTPGMDELARVGVVFTRAFATAPITMTAHASLLTGRYPPGHGARHNGLALNAAVPTLAESLSTAGFATGAFVGAFPLDGRFGLNRGFQTYSDRMPRDPSGRLANERPARTVAEEAVTWLNRHRGGRFFLWIHFFEPHAPYGNAADGRDVTARYDDEVAEADLQLRRVLDALGDARTSTVVAITADHGEAFGEHGEISHSIFVYDTTLRVPWILAGPSLPKRQITHPVSHIDLAPTVLRILRLGPIDADGIDLKESFEGRELPARDLYAESFAPLLDFGWSPLRTVRAQGWKFIEAPRPELYAVGEDPGEQRDRIKEDQDRAAALRKRLDRYGPPVLPQGTLSPGSVDADARRRLDALGYTSRGQTPSAARPDPKDRRALARRLAQVASGELRGELEAALRGILRIDPGNPQAHVRLGYVLQASSRCGEAVTHFRRAIDAELPGADAHLGLAACHAAARRFDAAAASLRQAERREPGNPAVAANLGVVLSDSGRPEEGIPHLQRALTADSSFNQARFYLAVALARAGRRPEAATEAAELLRRLPANAPQRSEVQRLIEALK